MIPLFILSIESPDDCEFIENLYLSYKRLMFSEILKITGDRWATEDIIQTVIVKLIGKLTLLRTLSKPKLINYIITASRNTALNHLRSLNRVIEVPYEDSIEDIAEYSSEIDNKLLIREQLENVHTAWKKLDNRNKRVLELKYVLEKTNEEISSELGIKPESVRMILTRARNSLKSHMKT